MSSIKPIILLEIMAATGRPICDKGKNQLQTTQCKNPTTLYIQRIKNLPRQKIFANRIPWNVLNCRLQKYLRVELPRLQNNYPF